MSDSENTSNNKPPPPSSPADGSKCTRHPDYYYEDGSTVFQAGDCLFKLQASLLKSDPGVEGYRFQSIMRRRLGSFGTSHDDPGSSDSHPIILPIEADPFALLIYTVIGRGGQPIIASAMATPPLAGRALETPLFLVSHLMVGVVASYFGMKSLQSWAGSRVRLILESAESVATQDWPSPYLKRLTDYLQTTDVPESQYDFVGFTQLVLSLAAVIPCNLSAEDLNLRLLTCAELYHTRELTTSNPILFGFVFAVLLSLGHRSSFWTERLTRDDRIIFYAAYANLTRLSEHNDLKLDWLIRSVGGDDACGFDCYQNLVQGWEKTFARCKRLDSSMPLEDINQILTFPKHRFAFARETSNQRSQLRCACAQKFLDKIDEAMRELFCGFAKKHEALAG